MYLPNVHILEHAMSIYTFNIHKLFGVAIYEKGELFYRSG